MNMTSRIDEPKKVYAIKKIQDITKKRQEHFCVVSLNGASEVIKVHVITIGIANRTLVHPREVFYPLIKDNACAFIAVHNHPSGNLEISDDDRSVTKRLDEASKLIGIPMFDHIIVSSEGYNSFKHGGHL